MMTAQRNPVWYLTIKKDMIGQKEANFEQLIEISEYSSMKS